MTGVRVAITALAATLGAALAASASAAGSPEVAALQVALRARALYAGAVDGVAGPQTAAALARFQLGTALRVSGSLDAPTRRALGSAPLGERLLTLGVAGWDVAALQFALAWHGFPCGPFDGIFGERTFGAVRRFQRWAGLAEDGVAGAEVVAALAGRVPRRTPRSRRPSRSSSAAASGRAATASTPGSTSTCRPAPPCAPPTPGASRTRAGGRAARATS
jgi:peptidoglycan hydrolase-like protein with peptidoglycan-binding domain